MDGEVIIGVNLNTKSFEKQINVLENKLNDIEATLQMADEDKTLFSTSEIKDMEVEAEKLRNKLIDLRKKQSETSKTDFSAIKSSINNIGTSVENLTAKISKWALALIGIRSIYSGIRSAVSLVSGENENVANQINVMKSAIANALLPLAQKILDIFAKLMIYINYIFKFITGKNLFDFEKAWSKSSKNAKATSSYTKEIRKTLAGFDEMNILNDNVKGSSGGGVGDIGDNIKLKNPFEGWEDYNIPKWLKKVAELTKKVTQNWEDFAGMLSLVGFALGALTGNIGLSLISLIVYLVTQIPRLTNAIKILTGSNSLLEAGAKTLFAVFVPHIGIPLILADALNDLTTATGSTAKASNNLRDAQKKLKEMQSKLTSVVENYEDALKEAKKRQEELSKVEKETKLSGEELYKMIQNGAISYLDMNESQKKVYKAYLDNKDAQEKLKQATDNLKVSEQNQKKALDDVKTATIEDALAKQRAKGDYEGYKKTVIDAYQSGKIKAGEARDYIEQACQDMTEANSKTFTKDLPKAIKEGLNPDKYKNAFSKLKAAWNDFWSNLKKNISVTIDTYVGSSGGASSSGKGRHAAKGAIIYPSVPRLASGGIINMPGRGVPLAYGGERGAEAVVPLTDSQQMDLLGQSIARHMVINLTNINQMNGRVISRELQKVQNESNFAFNR